MGSRRDKFSRGTHALFVGMRQTHSNMPRRSAATLLRGMRRKYGRSGARRIMRVRGAYALRRSYG